eukprot:c47201_g1_i1 orf=359-781(-)
MGTNFTVDAMGNAHSLIGWAYPINLRGLQRIPIGDFQDNKENIGAIPVTARSASRSPLPAWYPRLPLQDITAVLSSTQVDACKKGMKKAKTACCCRVVPVFAVRLDTNRSDIDRHKDGRLLPPSSSCMDMQNASLRKDFR